MTCVHAISRRHVDGVVAESAATIDLRAAAMPIIIKTAGFDVSPSDRWQILTLLRAVTCANLDAALFIFGSLSLGEFVVFFC